MKATLVHISNDYPDPLKAEKTQAIKNLVEATPEFRHVVYSLNRVNGIGGRVTLPFGKDRTAIGYGAMPKGLFWRNRLEDIARWIISDLEENGVTPSLIQAHKISIEGIAGIKLAEHFNCPLICDIQASSDIRIIKGKPNLHAYYGKIANRCAVIFPYAPWVVPTVNAYLKVDESKYVNLPVLPGFDRLIPSPSRGSNKLVTLMRFGDRANKNITGTMEALNKLSGTHSSLSLDVYGGGNANDLMELNKQAQKLKIVDRIHFKGPIDNAALPETLGQYTALIMPSFKESYGLVYAEALFCGLPVIYSKGQGIDGYFDSNKIGYACNPASSQDIAAAIEYVLRNEDVLKASIAGMQKAGELDGIRRQHIIDTYRNHITQALHG